MSSVYSVPESHKPLQTGSLFDDNSSQRTVREGTIAADDSDLSDDEVIDVLSDNETLVAEDDDDDDDDDDDFEIMDIKPSLASGNTFRPFPHDIVGSEIKPNIHLQQSVNQKPDTAARTRATFVSKGRLSEQQEGQIVALHEAGWTMARIGAHIDRSTNTVCSFLRRRKARLNAFVTTLPGSNVPRQRPAQRRRIQQRQQQTAAPTRATQQTDRSAVSAAIERELCGLQNEPGLRDVKPRFKKEEPL